MRDTTWAGQPQRLVDVNGVPKGMKQVLQERGINSDQMRAEDMRVVLANHDDFRNEKTVVETFLVGLFHTKVSLWIEPDWACLGTSKGVLSQTF